MSSMSASGSRRKARSSRAQLPSRRLARHVLLQAQNQDGQQTGDGHQEGAKHDKVLPEAGAHVEGRQQPTCLRLEANVEGQVEQKAQDGHGPAGHGHVADERAS